MKGSEKSTRKEEETRKLREVKKKEIKKYVERKE